MTVTTLVPVTADGGTGTTYWEPVGAASLLAALSDESDATTCWFKQYSAGTADRLFVTWDPPAGPLPGALVQSVVWRWRHAMQGATVDVGTFTLGTPYGSTVITTVRPTIQDAAFLTTLPGGVDAASFATGCWIDHPAGATSTDVRYFYRARIDVTWFNPPTINVTGPTGTVSGTSTPTITWETTGELIQRLIQLRLYEKATTLQPGFEPGQAEGRVYSRDFTTDTGQHRLEQALPNDSYVAYVQTRQTVNGTDQMSGWGSTEWTQNVAPPTVPDMPPLGVSDPRGYVLVQIAEPATSTPAVTRMELQRAIRPTPPVFDLFTEDDWEPIDNNIPSSPGTTASFYDHLIPAGHDVAYRARTVAVVGGEDIASAWAQTPITSPSWTFTGRYWLKAANLYKGGNDDRRFVKLLPAQNAIPDRLRTRLAGRHVVLDRVDPIITVDKLQTPENAVLTAITFVDRTQNPPTEDSRQELDELLAGDAVFFLQTDDEDATPSRYLTLVAHNRVREPTFPEAETTRYEVLTYHEQLQPAYDPGAVTPG